MAGIGPPVHLLSWARTSQTADLPPGRPGVGGAGGPKAQSWLRRYPPHGPLREAEEEALPTPHPCLGSPCPHPQERFLVNHPPNPDSAACLEGTGRKQGRRAGPGWKGGLGFPEPVAALCPLPCESLAGETGGVVPGVESWLWPPGSPRSPVQPKWLRLKQRGPKSQLP